MLVPDIKRKSKNNIQTSNIFIDDNRYGTPYNYEIATDEKKKIKFIRSIEAIIRGSYEYSTYLGILKNELNYSHCMIIPGLDIHDLKISIEFHHYPFTLFDLVSIEVDDYLNHERYAIDPFVIAENIMKYHFQNLIGLVPLSVTVHELVHDGSKFINEKYILGDYDAYIKKNYHMIDDSYIEKVDEIKNLSRMENEGTEIDNSILDINILNVVQENLDKELKPLKIKKRKAS